MLPEVCIAIRSGFKNWTITSEHIWIEKIGSPTLILSNISIIDCSVEMVHVYVGDEVLIPFCINLSNIEPRL